MPSVLSQGIGSKCGQKIDFKISFVVVRGCSGYSEFPKFVAIRGNLWLFVPEMSGNPCLKSGMR